MKIYLPGNSSPSSDPILDLLRISKTIAVVGLSSNPSRPSHEVSSYLQSVGYRIIPVNPNEREVLGAKSYPRLEDISEPIDIVDIFRRSEEVPPIIDSAIAIRAKAVWLQLGVISPQACEIARSAGLLAVEDLCLLVEHKKHRH
ncbi:MAG TPA: CoA-binding protein [Candidatus Acidoferrum sp.]|jgi:hypothetical protein